MPEVGSLLGGPRSIHPPLHVASTFADGVCVDTKDAATVHQHQGHVRSCIEVSTIQHGDQVAMSPCHPECRLSRLLSGSLDLSDVRAGGQVDMSQVDPEAGRHPSCTTLQYLGFQSHVGGMHMGGGATGTTPQGTPPAAPQTAANINRAAQSGSWKLHAADTAANSD